MALIDFDKFLASFITEMRECSQMRNFSIPRCIKKALVDQGLDYKGGEIIKTQCRVSAEAKENGYGESEDEIIRKHLIDCVTRTIPEADAFKEISKEQILDWLEKQGSEPNWCHHKVDLSNCSEEYRKAYYDGWNNCNMQHSQCAWSEEDERIINKILCICNDFERSFEMSPLSIKVIKEDVDKIDNWLLSIKKRIGG